MLYPIYGVVARVLRVHDPLRELDVDGRFAGVKVAVGVGVAGIAEQVLDLIRNSILLNGTPLWRGAQLLLPMDARGLGARVGEVRGVRVDPATTTQ